MGLIWTVIAAVAFLLLFWAGARWVMGGTEEQRQIRPAGQDDGPAEEPNLWPDRTGDRARRELGAREATDASFTGHRVETKPGATPPSAALRPAALGQEAAAELAPGTDSMAHAPAPGPNHIPPAGGQDLPPGTQP